LPRAQPGQRFGGRQKGTPNKVSGTLKDAVLEAAAEIGLDGKGLDGLKGYLKRIAETDCKAYSGLLGRILPMTLEGNADKPIEHKVAIVFRSAGASE
jgi:hypothetical protein